MVLSIPFFPLLHGRCLVKVRRGRKISVNAHRRLWFVSSSCIFYVSLSCAERAETRSYTRPHLYSHNILWTGKQKERKGPPPDVVANRKKLSSPASISFPHLGGEETEECRPRASTKRKKEKRRLMRWRNKCIEPLIFCAVAAADLKGGAPGIAILNRHITSEA